MSVLVVVRVEKSCVSGIEVCQEVDWYVCVIEESGQACEGKAAVWSGVSGGDQEVSVLGVNLGRQEVG